MSISSPVVRTPRSLVLASAAILAIAFPAAALATDSNAIDTEFSVAVDGCDATLTATGFDEPRETGTFAIYLDDEVIAEGDYDIELGQVLSFGPYTLESGGYVLVWDNEPGHDPAQSHLELEFDVECDPEEEDPEGEDPEPTPTPTDGQALPTAGVNPTGRPALTLPPTDTSSQAERGSASPALWPIAVGLGALAGVVFLLTPSPARARARVRSRRGR